MAFLRSTSCTAAQKDRRFIVKCVHLAGSYVVELLCARGAHRHYVRHESNLRKLAAVELTSMFRLLRYKDLERLLKAVTLPLIVTCKIVCQFL